jgi:hypothetical protein
MCSRQMDRKSGNWRRSYVGLTDSVQSTSELVAQVCPSIAPVIPRKYSSITYPLGWILRRVFKDHGIESQW